MKLINSQDYIQQIQILIVCTLCVISYSVSYMMGNMAERLTERKMEEVRETGYTEANKMTVWDSFQ